MKRLIIYSVKKLNKLFKRFLKEEFDEKNVREILVIMPQGLGDVLISTPALRALKNRFPRAKIDVYAYSWSSAILRNNKNVNKIIERRSLIKDIARLRKGNYDLGVNFELFTDNLISYLAKCKFRIGYNIEGNDLLLHKSAPYVRDRHVTRYALDVVNLVGAKSDEKMDIFLSKKGEHEARNFIKKNKIKNLIVLSPGGGNNPYKKSPEKVWAWQNFTQVIADNNKLGTFVLLGDNNDKKVCDKIWHKVKEKAKIYNLCGKYNILESAGFIKNSRLFIGNDSFLMHVASTFNIPSISLFGPTNPKRLAPLNKNSIYIKKSEDINKITADDVNNAIKLLSKNKK